MQEQGFGLVGLLLVVFRFKRDTLLGLVRLALHRLELAAFILQGELVVGLQKQRVVIDSLGHDRRISLDMLLQRHGHSLLALLQLLLLITATSLLGEQHLAGLRPHGVEILKALHQLRFGLG